MTRYQRSTLEWEKMPFYTRVVFLGCETSDEYSIACRRFLRSRGEQEPVIVHAALMLDETFYDVTLDGMGIIKYPVLSNLIEEVVIQPKESMEEVFNRLEDLVREDFSLKLIDFIKYSRGKKQTTLCTDVISHVLGEEKVERSRTPYELLQHIKQGGLKKWELITL